MAIDTRSIEHDDAVEYTPHRASGLERALGVLLMVGGAMAVAWALPTAVRYPMALAVAVSITAVGAGVAWQKPWAASGLLCLGLLLCSASIGYLLVQGPSLLTFGWFFVPGVYLIWVGVHGVIAMRRVAALHD